MIKVNNVSKTYITGGTTTMALDNVCMHVKEGEMVAIMGPSGAGKTTLLSIIGCMDTPDKGKLIINNNEVDYKNFNKLHEVRKNNISFVFQNYALMEKYTVYENVEMPLIARNIKLKDRKRMVEGCLEKLNILEISKKIPSKISGGQRQRVAIARALVSNVPIILADEPTGALDQNTGMDVIDLFKEINKEGKTILLITHDINVAKQCERIIEIVDGRISS